MSRYTTKPALFINELTHFFKNTHNEEQILSVDYQDYRTCVFIETDKNPLEHEVVLPDNIQTGYLLYKNEIYFSDEKSRPPHLLKTLSDSEVIALKKKLNYQALKNQDAALLLLESQLVYLSKFTGHQRKANFLTISLENEVLQWKFGNKESGCIQNKDDKLHPALSALYGTLYSYNHQSLPKEAHEKEEQKPDLYRFTMPKPTWSQQLVAPLNWFGNGIKAALRFLIFDNVLFKYTVGSVIAAIANYTNPHYKTESGMLSDFLARIIFPGGSRKPVVNSDGTISLDSVMSRQFMAVQRAELHRNSETGDYDFDGIPFKEFFIEMPDESTVSAVKAKNSLARKLDEEDQDKCVHLIVFNGNSGSYQDAMSHDAHALWQCEARGVPVELIRFNYPGVLNSTGNLEEHTELAASLIEAGIAQVQRLLDKGVKPENIQLQGTSLGGSISSYVASFYHARGQTLGALNASRTFSSTTNVAISYLNKVPYVGFILGFILRPVIAFGLWGTDWLLDTAKHFASLPDDKAWYTVARTPQKVHDFYTQEGEDIADDTILVFEASLHNSWRIQLKHFLAKNFGFFGYNQSMYKEMNAAHKLVTTFARDEEQGLGLSYGHCAHADVRPFGLTHNYNELAQQHPTAAVIPQLRVRAKNATSDTVNVKTGAILPGVVPDEHITIPTTMELGEQTIQFLVEHVAGANPQTRERPYFSRFFKTAEERSVKERVLSDTAQVLINLCP